MRKLVIIFLSIFLLSQVSHAQIDESHTFVYLNNDKVDYSDSIWLLNGEVIKKSNNRKFHKIEEIRFINAENGFFSNTLNIGSRRSPLLAKRTIKGDINLFESQTIYVENGYAPGAVQGGLFTKKKYYNYFNKGYETLKPVSYKALYPLFSKNHESMVYLDKYRNANINEHIFNIGQWVVYAGSFYLVYNSFQHNSKRDANFSPARSLILPLVFLLPGYGMRLVSNWFGTKKNEHLHEAFINYDGIK